jgi:hypothetical protein
MGADLKRLREVLSNSSRISLELICRYEFRFASARKPPKRSPPPRPKTDAAKAAAEAIAARGETVTRDKVMKEAGVSQQRAQMAIEAVRATQAAKAEIDAEALARAAEAALPKTTKEKYDIAERAMRKRLEAEFEWCVQVEATKRFEKFMKPLFESKLEMYEAVVAGRRGLFTKVQYNLIQACLHPDHVATLGEDWTRRHNEAFRLFRAAEIKLLDNRELPLTDDSPWKFKR